MSKGDKHIIGIAASVIVALLVLLSTVFITALVDHGTRLRTLERVKHIHSPDGRPKYPPHWRER